MSTPGLRIGLTGGIGSGKSAVGMLFEQHGICVIDADAIAHALTAPGGAAISEITQAFGSAMITASGAMDRALMRSCVFNDSAQKQRLEQILHPLIREQTEAAAQAADSPYVILMIPLLVEGGLPHRRVTRVLVVDCAEAAQVTRVMQRNGFDEGQVRAIMANQASRAARLAVADDVIDNNGNHAALAPQVDALHRRYLALAQASPKTPAAGGLT